jgi:hypothetical protein
MSRYQAALGSFAVSGSSPALHGFPHKAPRQDNELTATAPVEIADECGQTIPEGPQLQGLRILFRRRPGARTNGNADCCIETK